DELREQIPKIDAVLGTGEVPGIVAAIAPPGHSDTKTQRAFIPLLRANGERIESRIPTPESRNLPRYIYDADTPRLLATPRHYASVKVAEGCDYKCAFGIIRKLRGECRRRPADAFVRGADASP